MNFSPLSAASVLLVALALAGCGPKDGARELEQGKAAYEVRDLKKAEKLFEKSLACRPDDADPLLLLARVKLDLGDLDAAEGLVKAADGIAAGAPDVALLAAQVAWHRKDYAKASRDFASVADRTSLDAETRAQGCVGLGIVEMACNDVHLARVDFLKALRLDRRNASAWYHLALLYRDGFGYPETALEHLEIFVRLEASADPRVQKVQRVLIPALKETVARTLADRPGAAKRDSSSCSTLITKAEALWKKGDFRKAREAYQSAVEADALSYPAAEGLGRAWLKTDATKDGQTKALESYRKACVLRPSAVSTFLTTGALAARLGFHAQAVEVYSRAVAASPTSLDALDGLIRSLRKVGGQAKAADAYQAYRTMVAAAKKRN